MRVCVCVCVCVWKRERESGEARCNRPKKIARLYWVSTPLNFIRNWTRGIRNWSNQGPCRKGRTWHLADHRVGYFGGLIFFLVPLSYLLSLELYLFICDWPYVTLKSGSVLTVAPFSLGPFVMRINFYRWIKITAFLVHWVMLEFTSAPPCWTFTSQCGFGIWVPKAFLVTKCLAFNYSSSTILYYQWQKFTNGLPDRCLT